MMLSVILWFFLWYIKTFSATCSQIYNITSKIIIQKTKLNFFNFKIQPYVLRYVLSNLHYLSKTNNSKNEVKYFNFKIQPYVLRYVLLVNNINLDHFQNNKSKNDLKSIKLAQQHESWDYQYKPNSWTETK